MEDGKQLVKDNSDAAVHNSKAEKEEPSHQMDLQGDHKEFPDPQGMDFENEQPSHLVATHVESKEFPHSEDAQNPVEDSDQPLVKASASSGEGHVHEEQGLVEPSLVVGSATVADADINTDSVSGKTDGADMDPTVHPDSASLEERSLETGAEDETKEQFQNVVTTTQLPPDGGIVDEELNNGKLLQDNKTREGMKNGVTGTKLTLDTEIIGEGSSQAPNNARKGEVDSVVTEMELPIQTETKEVLSDAVTEMEVLADNDTKGEILKHELVVGHAIDVKNSNKSFLLDPNAVGGDESGTEEEQAAFMKELESFHKERCLEFKPPRFYGEPLNCLKLWRAVIRLGGYEQVTSCKLWRQVGESFKPPKTCTTVSWTFRCFYEKALLEYEKHKMHGGELPFSDTPFTEPTSAGNQVGHNQASGSGRARRDAAARAMQGWHSQRLLGNGEVGDPIIKDKNSAFTPKREKLKSIGLLKRKKSSPVERAVKVARLKASKPQLETVVVDIGAPADWVKINVQRTKDCFEVYALVPGLLREEVRVQSDPAGRLVISGQPEQLDNPWGVTPFKKVVSLPSRIDPHQTSAVVTLHGQLFVRVPFEQPDL